MRMVSVQSSLKSRHFDNNKRLEMHQSSELKAVAGYRLDSRSQDIASRSGDARVLLLVVIVVAVSAGR